MRYCRRSQAATMPEPRQSSQRTGRSSVNRILHLLTAGLETPNASATR